MNIRELEEALSYYPEDAEVVFTYGDTLAFNHVIHSPAEAQGTICLEMVNKGMQGTIDQRSHQGDFTALRGSEFSMLRELYSAACRFRYCKKFESERLIEEAEKTLLAVVRQNTKVFAALSPDPCPSEKPRTPFRVLAKTPSPEDT